MKIVSRSPVASDAVVLPVTREVWVVTAGVSQGHIDIKTTRTWRITAGEIMDEQGYEEINQEIREYAARVKQQARVRWVRVEWIAFDRLDVAS